ncbi:OmpA family protein [Photobacterium atrarenae]|uniref:OmpA family protein n=1 Tax=Photobacterium atrarenae TaxID=865757 RepID=A0ABY5GM47_9GAMM|nr:OmpA family protein [Photobacterium atrarenae]UTV29622.1 OmpA family protein [Photobacterium atrarenae]
MTRLAAVISATLLMASTAHADVYVGGKAGKSWLEDACQAGTSCDKDDTTYGVFGGYNLSDNLAIEAGYDNLGDYKSTTFNDHVEAITLAPKLSLPLTNDLALYGKLGGAYVKYGSQDDFSYLGAAGVEYSMSQNVTLRAEYQNITDASNDLVRATGHSATLGLAYTFGGNSKPVVKTEPVVYEEPVAYETPAPEPEPIVREESAPIAPVMPVETEEVVEPEIVTKTYETQTLGTGSFALNSTELTQESAAKLDKLVAFLNEYPQAKVEVVGYTDASGAASYNQKISEKRAGSVAEALINKGIKATRIEARGEGENNPIASNETREGRQQNRRVEITVPAFDYQVQA